MLKNIDFNKNSNKVWMTVKDTAKYLSKTENAIYLLIHRKILISYKLGRCIYLNKLEIDNLLQKSRLFQGG